MNVMKRAWEIARDGQKKFGGKVKEYFSEALKMAWAEIKQGGKIKGLLHKFELGELEGTEKQIAWAKEIRKKAMVVLANEIKKDGKRPVDGLFKALFSKESIEEYCNNKAGQMRERTIEAANNLLDRFERAKEILSNTSAKFWIEYRDNQPKNYMFKNFINYVQNGEAF